MDTAKLVKKLKNFFDLSKKKQRKKHDKLLKIIGKLKEKRSSLESELAKQAEIDASGERYHDLQQELQVIAGLIYKAKRQDLDD